MKKESNTLRLHLSGQFVQIPNSTVRDKNLSFRATGLLVYMLSMSNGWIFSVNRLGQSKRDGKDSAAAAARELEAVGYLFRERSRDVSGRLTGVTWHIADHPAFLGGSADLPQQANPDTGIPHLDCPDTGIPPLRKPCKQEHHHLEKNDGEASTADHEKSMKAADDLTQLLNSARSVGEIGERTSGALITLIAKTWLEHGGDRAKDVKHVRTFIKELPVPVAEDESDSDKWDEKLAWAVLRCNFPSELTQMEVL